MTSDLTAVQLRLVQIMREYQFGRLENMPIQNGQPLVDRGVKIVHVVRLGDGNRGSNAAVAPEFELKQPVRDLFDELTRLCDGLIVKLEFRHGLPFLLETTTVIRIEDRASTTLPKTVTSKTS